MASRVKPGRGSERVKAWVYAILNPVIDSLCRETDLLRGGNLSWRAYKKRCEYIHPINELIDTSHRPILDDFLAEDSTVRDRFGEHDSALAKLEEIAGKFFQLLVQSSSFQQQVAECLNGYQSKRASNPVLPELLDMRSRIPEYVAEFIINNAESLPRQYTMYSFWEEYRHQFSQFKRDGTFNAVRDAAGSLWETSERLKRDLESRRLELVREYDIPAAPIYTPQSASEDVFR
jgi:hypothetical protein